MSNARLVPCPACDRHVRVLEEVCPFCAAALPDRAASSSSPTFVTRGRLSRAALFALGASVASCGKATVIDSPGTTDATPSDPEPRAIYGAPPAYDAGGVVIAPPYGIPPPIPPPPLIDAGEKDASSATRPQNTNLPRPPYGAPPPPPRDGGTKRRDPDGF